MERNKLLDSPRLSELKRERKKSSNIKMVLFFAVCLIVLIAFVFLYRWQRIKIGIINITGNHIIESKAIENTIKNDLSGNYLWILPRSNFLFFPKNKIIKDLSTEFRRLKEIHLSTDSFNTLNVSLSEREAKYIWCGESLVSSDPSMTPNKCFFVDENGFVFDEAPQFSDGVYLKLFGVIKDSIFLKDSFKKLIQFKDSLIKMDFKLSAVTVKEDGSMELYLLSNTLPPGGPKILIKQDADYENVSRVLSSAIATEPLKSDLKKRYEELLYIDLRYGNKVFYKFQ